MIPDSTTQQWISTNPKKHVEIVSQANTQHGGNFVPLVKMIKGWNVQVVRHFRSFHLEVLALAILNNVTISDFPSGVRHFFDKARESITKKNPDPAGYGDDVGRYINSQEKIRDAATRFQLAYDRAQKAEEFARRGNVRDAVDMWVKVFGSYFPAYG